MISRLQKVVFFTVTFLTTTLILTSHVMAQPCCKVRTFTIDEGLAANNISEFAQAADGMMWVSTWNGLCCYDGYNFSTFRDKHDGNQVLTSNYLRFIRPAASGDIWCSSYGGGAFLFDRSTCRFIDVGKIISHSLKIKLSVRNILSLGNGYAWILGTQSKCVRIDERQIKKGEGMRLIDTGKTCYKGMIRKISLDDNGREWLFADNGVALYGSTVFLPYRFEYFVQKGRKLFFSTVDGCFAVYEKRLKIIPLTGKIKKINAMKMVGRYIVLATDNGLLIYDTSTGRQRLISVSSPTMQQAEVSEIFIDSRQRVWAFTAGRGVNLINCTDGSSLWLNSETSNWYGTYSRDPMFHEDANHTVWIVPRQGIFSYFDENTHKLVPYNLNADNNSRLPVSYIVKYCKDTQGNLWFTGNHNLILVNFSQHDFRFISTVSDDDTRALMLRADGSLWTGMKGGYITIHDASHHMIGYLASDGSVSHNKVRLSSSGIYAIYESHDGTVWIGTKGDGIYVLSKKSGNNRMRHLRHDVTDKQSLSHDNVFDFCEDAMGRLWVATLGGGLNVAVSHTDGSISFINSNNSMSKLKEGLYNKVRRLTLLTDGVMAASTNSGIVTFRPPQNLKKGFKYYYTTHIQGDASSLKAADVLSVCLSRSSKLLYAATLGGGLQVTDEANLLRDNLPFRNVKGFDAEKGTVQSVAEDMQGNIWLIRESTVNRLNQHTHQCETYGADDWIEERCFTETKPCISNKDSSITLGIMGGVLRFYPQNVRKSTYKPIIIFSGVQFQGDHQPTPIFGQNVLEIPSDERNATVFFSALDYTGNQHIRYAYKIKEIDTEWSYTGTSHSASLNHISAGRYTLLVRSTNSDGVWVENEQQLRIHIHPTFWETGWAWLLYAVIALCVLFGVLYVWWLRYKIEMEKSIKERQLRFFTNISHQLRTPLTLIEEPVRQVLTDEPLSDKARTYLEFVKNNAARMLSLVNKSLDLKKLETSSESGDDTSNYNVSDNTVPSAMLQEKQATNTEERVSMLIVEDNDELRYFLVSTLSADYSVTEAHNGQEGFELALSKQPEFIITDIMMPVMDGMTMIRQIKASPVICHIPIIVLSARTAESYRIEGFNEGIDDYITKPFSVPYLKSRVANIINQRRQLQQTYVQIVSGDKTSNEQQKEILPQLTTADKDFIDKLVTWIEANMKDPDLRIDDIAYAVGMSRTVLYGKVKSLLGMSPVDFVRHLRITRAARLIKESHLYFSEIAYKVGFTDPKYFGRTFKAKTGMSPSEYRKHKGA